MTDIDYEARANELEFRTQREVHKHGMQTGMEMTVYCFVFDKAGNRVIWPSTGPSLITPYMPSPGTRRSGAASPGVNHNERRITSGTPSQ